MSRPAAAPTRAGIGYTGGRPLGFVCMGRFEPGISPPLLWQQRLFALVRQFGVFR